MDTRPRYEGRGLRPFRLSDLPMKIRKRGVDIAIKRTNGFYESLEIARVAEHPSDRVYYVSREAWDRVMKLG